eukprot:NODE_2248_length_735_cov_600.384840_g1815_i0.p2 GENE.NODE_2248_length_735_cov_600.384840_g1815_i0~~NODE_2248_length_735_cov_600.384840_g1815_i0.p2  ORF type:complete len:127 (+),score=7.78 NODE_2248_length_735_cov_600.384840_g1815_i0:99-479(+)
MVYRERRVQYRRHNTVNTRSNKIKLVRTPGGRLLVHNRRKGGGKGPRTPTSMGGKRIQGIKALTALQRKRIKNSKNKGQLTVSRTYGGVLSHDLVKDRIIRAFLIEEQKIVKRVLKAQGRKSRRRD